MIETSVIIPTYNRVASLRQTLGALALQTYPATKYEVLVVDDGSTDLTPEVAQERFNFELTYLRQKNQGSAAARNTGAFRASGSFLVFLDDDMTAGPEYLQGLVEDHSRHQRMIGMGRLAPYLPQDASLFQQVYARQVNRGDDHPALSGDPVGSFIDFTTCVTNNLSVGRDDFFEIGMMQDVGGDGPTWWGDVDFGYRARGLGFRFFRSGKAVCVHRDNSLRSLESYSKRMVQSAYLAPALVHKYPDILPFLKMFNDKTPIDWRRDTLRLVARKLAWQIASSDPVVWGLEAAARSYEAGGHATPSLERVYRWILGAYIYRGFRSGLRYDWVKSNG